jgi:uncharacterized protein (TIGR00255 family)
VKAHVMINSMTGYGEAEGEVNGVSYAVEIKAVNNRYLKTNIKLSETAAFLEEDIEKLLRDNLFRGTINYVLRLKPQTPVSTLFDIDETTLRTILERLSRLKTSADIGSSWHIDIGSLLNLPGIIRPIQPDQETAERIKNTVLDITQAAIEKLKQMRAAEGNALEADLNSHCEAIRQSLDQIRGLGPIVVQEYAKKLKKRVDELLAEAKLKLDGDTLARETAILAERSDISEEIARLDSHLQRFYECCQANGQAGRRLEFISQEMLREANTIASKAFDVGIINHIVNIKCEIDRIKEQVQNLE